jgi:hypothetical protein
MNLLSEIISRLNQRIGVANIFDKQFGLCELNANGNDKAWIHYIGDGQGEVVTNFDAKQGTIFWAKRGKVNISIIDSLKVSGCKKMYQTTFPLTAYAVVRKSHLPCDSEDAQDWIASRVFKLTSGMDFGFKQSIGVMSYEVIPNGYANEIKSLTQNYEWACVSIDIDVQIVSSADDGCYDTCQTGEIPLPPNYAPCTPCLTEVAVDGVTITGNGTVADPLVAIGGGGGGSIRIQNEGVTLTNAATNIDFIGNAVNATLNAPGDVHVNINQVQSDWNAASGLGEILNKPTIPAAQIQSDWTQANNAALDFIQNKPTIPAAQVNSDWNAVSGVAEILNKPTLNAGTVTSVSATVPVALSVTVTDPTTTPAIAITAAGVASQYIRGDGQLATLPSNASGGSAVSYYLNGGTAASVATYFQMSQTAVIGTGVDFSKAGNGLISQWLTDANDPNRLEIPAGNWNFEIFMSASSAGGTPAFYVELLKYDGVTFTTIANSSAAPENITSGTAIDLYLTSLAIPQTTLLVTDRLAIRVYIVNSVGGRTITMHTQDSHLCQVVTNFAGGIAALNGLSANTQYLAVGTAGTDFAISSVTDIHTFNLPTASAANRGALSSADWIIFNNKVSVGNSPLAWAKAMYLTTINQLGVLYVSSVDKLYVCNNSSNTVTIFNATTGQLLSTVANTGALLPFYSPTSGEVYITSTTLTTLNRISTSTNSSLGTIAGATANGNDAIEYSSTKIFIPCSNATGSMLVLNPSTNTISATITTGMPAFPVGIALNSNVASLQNGKIVVSGNGGVAIFDPSTNAITTITANPSTSISGARSIRYISSLDQYVIANNGNVNIIVLSVLTATTFAVANTISSVLGVQDVVVDEASNYIITTIATTGTTQLAFQVYDMTTKYSLFTMPTSVNGSSAAGRIHLDSLNKRAFIVGRSAGANNVGLIYYNS